MSLPAWIPRAVVAGVAACLASCGSSSNQGSTCATGLPKNSHLVRAAPARACFVPIAHYPLDPLYGYQWHLNNTGQTCGTAGEDLNVESVWASRKGDGVRIAIIDDGLELTHEDLSANIVAGASWDYIGRDSDPNSCSHSHGTSIAGIAAARDENGKGVRGVAPHAQLVAYNVLQNLTASNEADAMTRDAANNAVSSNSWGPEDGFGTLDASDVTWRTAINTGLTTGRNGRGLIYVWAGGNGAPTDNSNYDGKANYRGVIAVGAVTDTGVKASYSERGANLWVSAPGGESCGNAIATTDRSGDAGYNTGIVNDFSDTNYTQCFNATSAATPMVSGVVALMLQANPNLGWRDARLILAHSARKNHIGDSEWATNGGGLNINHNYGFGVADAQAAVTRALTWTNVGPELTHTSATVTPNSAIPDNAVAGISSPIAIAGSGIGKIEFVEIVFSADHPYSGDLDISLTGPSGTVSRLAETHTCTTCTAYNGWVFGSARHLDESADGNWTLTVKDLQSRHSGTFRSWSLKFYGRAN